MSGYSQGAQLVHNAASQLSTAVANRITAGKYWLSLVCQELTNARSVLTFGDPKRTQGFGAIPASRTKIICRDGDNICEGGINPTGPHTRYQENAPEAAAWVASRVA